MSFALCAFFLALCLFLPVHTAFAASGEPSSNIDSYLLADLDTGEIIFANIPDERVNPASLTKIMTALVLLEQVSDLSEKVTVGSEINAFGPEASMMGLIQYEQISYLDLLYGMMLESGNDAAATVAVNIGGSISGFADLMNAKAAELGMYNSHFVNPHGMTDESHYTTSADLFKLVCACMKYEIFAQVVSTSSYTTAPTNKAANGHTLQTTNRLISDKEKYASYNYDGAIGIKTGSTSAAKGCLVAAAQKNGRTLIAIFMGDDSYIDGQKYIKRWTDATKFFDYGFSLTRVDLVSYMEQVPLIAEIPGAQGTPDLLANLPETLGYWADTETAERITQEDALDVVIEYNDSYSVLFPFQTPLGIAVYSYEGEELCRAPVYVQPSVAAQPVQAENDSSFVWPRGLTIALWALAFLICLSLLFFILVVPRIKRKRRTLRTKKSTSRSSREELPLPHKDTNTNQRLHSRMVNGRVQKINTPPNRNNGSANIQKSDNIRVLRTHRRTGSVKNSPLYGDDTDDKPKR